ncbi:MAG: glutamate--tRNA ligase, partial [Gluconobacter oxydans]
AEVLSREEQIKLFDLDGVGRSPSRMDYVKLAHLNGIWMRQANDERLTNDVMERLQGREGVVTDDKTRARILAMMPGLKERAKTLVELADNAAFAGFTLPLTFTPKAEKLLGEDGRKVLEGVGKELAALKDFTPEAIDATLRSYAEKHEIKLGSVAQPLRAAMTGSTTSPGIDLTLSALGQDEVLARIATVLASGSIDA